MDKPLLGILMLLLLPFMAGEQLFAANENESADEVREDKGKIQKYMRSSLGTVMVYHPEDEFGADIGNAFLAMPKPDKYNDHDVLLKVLYNDSIVVRGRRKTGLYKAQYGNSLSKKEVRKNGETLEDLLNSRQYAKAMVARWFNFLKTDSGYVFNADLIRERGLYNATEADVDLALKTTRGVALLSDEGEELIGNTYVLVNDMTYITAEERAAAAKVALSILGGIMDGIVGGHAGSDLADAGGDIADSFTGFTVKNHSYLFRLVWNDSIAAEFYQRYYTEIPDTAKIMAFFRDSSTFRLEYVAHEYESGSKTTLKGNYDRSDLVKIVCTRSIDKNIAALQLQYEDFKVKTPITEVLYNAKGKATGYAAQIGLKESISEKSTFSVLQQSYDPETNQTGYKVVAKLKPVKGKIWDNRYMATAEKDEGSELSYTTFKKTSGGDIYPGMLIVEGNYKKASDD